MQLGFRDCHAKIIQVDSLETVGNGVVVLVSILLFINKNLCIVIYLTLLLLYNLISFIPMILSGFCAVPSIWQIRNKNQSPNKNNVGKIDV